MTERILVGVDSSVPSRAALLWAAERALRLGVPEITALHVLDDPNRVPGSNRSDRAFERAERVLTQRTQVVAALAPTLSISHVIVRGRVCKTIAEHSASFDVVVVGTQTSHILGGQKARSLGVRLAETCQCTTVIVPGSRATRSRLIIVGVGVSTTPESAFDFAAAEAENQGCDLSLLTVHSTAREIASAALSPRDHAVALEKAAAVLRAQHPKLVITRSIVSVSDSASAAFDRASYRARMIVLGAPDGYRPGSVSTFEEIVGSSSVPVAVVRGVALEPIELCLVSETEPVRKIVHA